MSNISEKPFVVMGAGGIELSSHTTMEEAYEELQRILSGDPDMTPEVMESYFEVTLTKKERRAPKRAIEMEEVPHAEEIPATFPWEL